MINWKVRIRNMNFWISIVPALLLLVQQVAALFGYELELTEVGQNLLNIIRTAFVVLALVGVVNDPTTSGIADSAQAMAYETPKKQ